MVGFLVFRVQRVIRPPTDALNANTFPPPRSNVGPNVPVPGAPPPLPPLPPPDSWTDLKNRDPFVYQRTGERRGGPDEADPLAGVRVLNIRMVNNEPRAQIDTGRGARARWYGEGYEFEDFSIQTINPEEGYVELYAANVAKIVRKDVEER